MDLVSTIGRMAFTAIGLTIILGAVTVGEAGIAGVAIMADGVAVVATGVVMAVGVAGSNLNIARNIGLQWLICKISSYWE
jgi:hypothetical protein